jgi:hypothetical protein
MFKLWTDSLAKVKRRETEKQKLNEAQSGEARVLVEAPGRHTGASERLCNKPCRGKIENERWRERKLTRSEHREIEEHEIHLPLRDQCSKDITENRGNTYEWMRYSMKNAELLEFAKKRYLWPASP